MFVVPKINNAMEEDGIWKEQWKVAAFMVDTNQRIRLKSLADILQELANNHANFRKCGFEDMKSNGKFWVLNRQVIIIDQWPIWEQQLHVESWISMMKGPFSLRHFAVTNMQGQMMVRASYLWTCIDKEKKKPSTIPDGDFPVIEKRAFEVPQPYKLKLSGDEISKNTYSVRDSDLDIIGHTNNASYLEWAANNIDRRKFDYHRIDANYTGESFKGDEISISLLKSSDSERIIEISNHSQKSLFKCKLHLK